METKYSDISIDKQVGEILDEVYENTYHRELKQKAFFNKYSGIKSEDIDWNELCEDGKINPRITYSFLLKILEENLYQGPYKDYLYSIYPDLKRIFSKDSKHYNKVFCGDDIKYLIITEFVARKSVGCTNLLFYLESNNPVVKELFIKMLSTAETLTSKLFTTGPLREFEKSLGSYGSNIKSYKDFGAPTLFAQIGYYKQFYKNDDKNLDISISLMLSFYRWLCTEYSEYNFFKSSFKMHKQLLFSRAVFRLLKEGYYFTTYNPSITQEQHLKTCYLLRDFSNETTRSADEDFVIIDLSDIYCKDYQDIMFKYMNHNSSDAITSKVNSYYRLKDILNFIHKLKKEPNYPNPKLLYINSKETLLIKQYIESLSLAQATKNQIIWLTKKLLEFAKDNKLLKLDIVALDVLTIYGISEKSKAVAINDEDLIKINNALLNKAKTDDFYKVMYAIFYLALQTSFRISQICHLKIDCIKNTAKSGQYFVESTSKTSRGDKEHYVITDLTYKILKNIIEDTENLREKCTIEGYKKCMFLYWNTSPSGVRCFDDNVFTIQLKNLCKELELKQEYTASNLRDTYMTKAFEYILKTGKSDIEMAILSNHKRIDTTKNHYIESQLENMLEATYGIIIGGNKLIDTDNKVIGTLPEELNTPKRDVENGCGKCSVEHCQSKSAFPCLTCKHFVTTPDHEIYFIKAIKIIDEKIKRATTAHDIEDFNTIKQLYVLYLKEIYLFKEKEDEL